MLALWTAVKVEHGTPPARVYFSEVSRAGSPPRKNGVAGGSLFYAPDMPTTASDLADHLDQSIPTAAQANEQRIVTPAVTQTANACNASL
jgi:hypothetical protein